MLTLTVHVVICCNVSHVLAMYLHMNIWAGQRGELEGST